MARWTILGEAGDITFDASGVMGRAPSRGGDALPFQTGWIGYLSYELGWQSEPAAAAHRFSDQRPATRPRASMWPLAAFARVDRSLVFDHETGVWYECGSPGLAAQVLTGKPRDLNVLPWEPKAMMGAAAYQHAVSRAIDYIRAGDVYQVNLAHELRSQWSGDPLGWFISRGSQHRPRYGCFLRLNDGRAIASLSPELFLELGTAGERLVTSPMKGTRAGEADARELRESIKDLAELAMIVDLLRNDLGRVCQLGSVRVDVPHRVERHGEAGAGVLQSTATISGLPRGGQRITDVVMGCFPGGSVTGAPKVRAMQIIEELEFKPRGPYCGAAGFISDSGALRLNVAIRTALFESSEVSYSVGAGIVADSDPTSEWLETLLKARAASA